MAAVHSSRTARPPAPWEEVAHTPHRYLLPVAGAVAVGAGGVALVGLGPAAAPYVAAGLVAVGAVALVSAMSHRRAPIAPPAAPPGSAPPRPVAARTAGRAATTPHSGLGRVATSSVSWSGEEIWQRWRRPASSHLGAEVIPPVGSTAYVPPRTGAIHPFGARDRDLWFMPSMPLPPERRPGTAAPTGSRTGAALHPRGTHAHHGVRAGPYTDDELDRLFPPEAEPPASSTSPPEEAPRLSSPPELPTAPEPRAPPPTPTMEERVYRERSAPAADGFSGDVGGPWSGLGSLSGAGAIDHLLYLEAINPVPPHLRPPAEDPPGARPPPARPALAALPTSCGSCRRGLGDFRTWSSCARCGRPICRRCLALSIRFGEDGVCWDCSESALAHAS